MDSYKNMCKQSHIKGKTHKARLSELYRLLQQSKAYFEIELNRRMPNGTYGGVRGRRKSALLDCPGGVHTPPGLFVLKFVLQYSYGYDKIDIIKLYIMLIMKEGIIYVSCSGLL